MNVTILAVGKLKERFFEEGCAEYVKRLARYCILRVREAADEKAPESLSPAQEEQVKDREGKRLLSLLDPRDHVIALTVTGKAYTSEELAERMGALRDQGRNVSFLIGGSLGLSQEAVNRADEELSLSKLTLPHRLARLVLLEQLYRSFKILNHETYHK
ncbi:MAG: 23S rRNA (pseudouridine(1915)-N(3))-methyltransferase RlmH [Clostridia bacterium]|nr:23S rRNA (pseudouridine(1915)-N(3))-methyltransferase RlmH [Clostridia bacterium]